MEEKNTLSHVVRFDDTQFKEAMSDTTRIAHAFTRSLTTAFTGVAVKGKSLSDVISGIGLSLSRLALNMAFRPLETSFQKWFEPLMAGLTGVAPVPGPPMNIMPFAKGGVVSAPTFFSSHGSLGLAGERGSEAILPLARDSSGHLGVRMQGQASTGGVTINITTPDVEGFRRSQSEIAASLARLVSRGQRGL